MQQTLMILIRESINTWIIVVYTRARKKKYWKGSLADCNQRNKKKTKYKCFCSNIIIMSFESFKVCIFFSILFHCVSSFCDSWKLLTFIRWHFHKGSQKNQRETNNNQMIQRKKEKEKRTKIECKNFNYSHTKIARWYSQCRQQIAFYYYF